MVDEDLGGDPACWAHRFTDESGLGADGEVTHVQPIRPQFDHLQTDRHVRPAAQRATPSHPHLAAAVLMISVVVFLILVSAITVL